MALTIDWPNKQLVISVDTTFSFHDIYVAVMDWSALSWNMQYLIPLSSSGNAPLWGWLFTDIIYVIENWWKIKPSWYTSWTQISIVGTLITSDGSNPTTPPTTGWVPQFLFKVATNGIISTSGWWGGWLTSPQDAKLTSIYDTVTLNLDAKVSEVIWGGGGLTTEEHDKLFSLENSTGGGGFSSQVIQNSIANAKRDIIEKIDEIPKISLEKVETQLSENQSQIDIAKTEIIDTIKSSETEICSDVIRKTKEIKEDNVKTRNLVRQKSEKIDKNVSKLADRQDMTDQMIEDEADELEKIIEQNIDMEADNIESEINKQIDKEIEEIESNQSANGNNNGTEG